MSSKALAGVVATAAVVLVATIALVSIRKSTLHVEDILGSYRAGANYTGIAVSYPADGTLFPPEIVAPTASTLSLPGPRPTISRTPADRAKSC